MTAHTTPDTRPVDPLLALGEELPADVLAHWPTMETAEERAHIGRFIAREREHARDAIVAAGSSRSSLGGPVRQIPPPSDVPTQEQVDAERYAYRLEQATAAAVPARLAAKRQAEQEAKSTCRVCGQPDLDLAGFSGGGHGLAAGQRITLPGGEQLVACRRCILEATRQVQDLVARDQLGDGRTRTQAVAAFLATTTLAASASPRGRRWRGGRDA